MELEAAAKSGNLGRLRELLTSSTFDPARLDSVLTEAVIYGRFEVVRLLLEHGAPVNHRLGLERTPLFYATRSRAMIDLLLSHGADIHACDSGGYDVLHTYLVSVGPGSGLGKAELDTVKRLVEAGLEVRNAKHTLVAIATRDLSILEYLLERGADPNASDREGGTLWRAVQTYESSRGALALLVKYGVDPNARLDVMDTTILMEVCQRGDLGTARELLDRGADVNAKSKKGTALSRAEESGNRVLVDFLLERGATPLRAPLDGDAARALDVAERGVTVDDLPARLRWAETLSEHGFRAAAASEVTALRARGVVIPEALDQRLSFENPVGTRWTFAPFIRPHAGVAPRTADQYFPGARVTDGQRVLPLVLVLEAACVHCDEKGEHVCGLCNGAGSYPSFLDPDHDRDCDPRQTCTRCRGLHFECVSTALGKGACAHAMEVELSLDRETLHRCRLCGLASLGKAFACGVCGHFMCRCAR